MNKKAAMNLNLAIEEITVSNLLPSLEFAEKGHIDLIIRAGESGRGMELDVDYSDIKDVVNPFDGGWDEISEKILSKIIKRKKSGREGVASFEIQGV